MDESSVCVCVSLCDTRRALMEGEWSVKEEAPSPAVVQSYAAMCKTTTEDLLDALRYANLFNSPCSSNMIRDIAWRSGNYSVSELGSRLGLEDYEIANHVASAEAPYEQRCQLFLRWRQTLGNAATCGNFFLGLLKLKPLDMRFLNSVVELMGARHVTVDLCENDCEYQDVLLKKDPDLCENDYEYQDVLLKKDPDSCEKDHCCEQQQKQDESQSLDTLVFKYVADLLNQEVLNKQSMTERMADLVHENTKLRREKTDLNKENVRLRHRDKWLMKKNRQLQRENSGLCKRESQKLSSPDSVTSFTSPDTPILS